MRSLLLFFSLFCLCSCGSKSENTLKVAATPVPHAEILEFIKPDLAAQNIDLNVIVVDDFNTPNRALADKEIDANYFQHQPFLDKQKKDFGYELISMGPIHIEPMGLYSKKIQSLKELKKGSLVAVPNDPTNEARALLLLEKQGLIKLSRHDSNASVVDIIENPLQLSFTEIDSPLLARSLDDVALAAITTNFALQAKLSPQKDALLLEDSNSPYANILVVRSGEENNPKIQALKAALQSQKVKEFIEKKYQGAVLPAN